MGEGEWRTGVLLLCSFLLWLQPLWGGSPPWALAAGPSSSAPQAQCGDGPPRLLTQGAALSPAPL